jgi:hypothetical protein
VRTLNLAGLIDQYAQRFTGAIKSMRQQRCICRLQGVGFNT